MNQVTLLRNVLRPHFAWHGARLSFVAAFLIALLRVKTGNFAEQQPLAVATLKSIFITSDSRDFSTTTRWMTPKLRKLDSLKSANPHLSLTAKNLGQAINLNPMQKLAPSL